jgi:hypothetical protein
MQRPNISIRSQLLLALGLLLLVVSIAFGVSVLVADRPLSLFSILIILGLSLGGAAAFVSGVNDAFQIVERIFAKGARSEQSSVPMNERSQQETARRGQWLPSLPAHYLPREEELEDLREKVLAGSHRLIGVCGMGGTGKTVIVAAFAREFIVRQTFSGGIYWLSFGEHFTQADLINRQIQLARELGQETAFADVQQGKAELG